MPDALTLTVTDVTVETPSTRRLRVTLDGVPFAYRAGQGVALGLHGQPERRPYSIACAPEVARATGQLEFLLRVDGLGRLGLHLDDLTPGARLDIEGPFGDLTLPEPLPEVPLVFIAGGTGITPLRALMQAARHADHRLPMPLLYSVRSATDVAYARDWQAWAEEGRGPVQLTITRPPDWRPGTATHRLGRPALAQVVPAYPAALHFVCGPPGFVDDVTAALSQAGVRSDRIRREGW